MLLLQRCCANIFQIEVSFSLHERLKSRLWLVELLLGLLLRLVSLVVLQRQVHCHAKFHREW